MKENEIFDKLNEITKNSPCIVCIQTQEDTIVFGNDSIYDLDSKEKQSICFALIHTIVTTFAEYE